MRSGGPAESRVHPHLHVRRILAVLLGTAAGCVQYISPPTEAPPAQRLAAVEGLFRDARDLYFQAYVTEGGGHDRNARGRSLDQLRTSERVLRERALERLGELDPDSYRGDDRRALDRMREMLSQPPGAGDSGGAAGCPHPTEVTGLPADLLGARIYVCYGRAAARLMVGRDTLDRLGVLSRLATEPDPARRRLLFLALQPVWQSVNAGNTPMSPWRVLLQHRAARWKAEGSPVVAAARSLGLAPGDVEPTLRALLDAWRRATPDTLVEPWEWYHQNAAASRRLSPRVPRQDLERLNESYYAGVGASPRALGITYDLEPRPGKSPVAFTQFGGVPRQTRDSATGADPHVVATYRDGGLGNLVELLHESGHAIHIAAINTRPAFADWPDSDPFTEGLADVPALEVYEGGWQFRTLGDSASRRDNLREKYGGVMLDVAWALFEVRMHADPSRDPNAEWTELTQRYLHIAPHPEWSWWAMRGQLIDSPGYMMNYALGAMVAADVRARIVERWGGFTDRRLYGRLVESLYRFGLERTAREVLAQFLGRRVGPDAIVRDLGVMGPG